MKKRLNPFLGTLAVIAMTQAAAYAANGAAYYFDVDGTTSGFGAPSGTYANNINWSTSNTGVIATGAYAAGAQLTFGNTGTDLTGSTFAINLSTGTSFAGILINSTSANVTLSGTGNAFLSTAQTWTVAAGSTLNENATFQANGMNFNNQTLSLEGGGTINFGTGIGNNSSALITQNMTGTGSVNLKQTAAATTAYSGGYTLTAGTLNFETGSAAVAFSQFASGKLFSINGGTIDNKGTSAQTLSLGSGTYSFGGNFTFTGTQNLSLGTAAVALGSSVRQITTTANTLTIGGTVSGTGGITKLGAGTLALSGANTYSGATTLTTGTLNLSNQNAVRGSTLTMGGGTLAFDQTVSGNAFTFGGLAATAAGAGYNVALLNNAGSPAAIALTVGGNNASTTYAGVLSGTGGSLIKTGTGTLALSNSNLYTGTTSANGGILRLSFPTGTVSDILSSSSALALGGGSLLVTQASGATSNQTVNGVTVNAGASYISVIRSGSSMQVNLGNITQAGVGGTLAMIAPTGGTSPLLTSTATNVNNIVGDGRYLVITLLHQISSKQTELRR